MDLPRAWMTAQRLSHALSLLPHRRHSQADAARLRLFGVTFLVLVTGASADPVQTRVPDIAREQRMAAEIVDAILDGEPVTLETAQGRQFLGIHTRSIDSPARGTVIILHGRGFHPDWGDVVQPMRTGLTETGWDTLSIQLPVLHKEARYFDYTGIFDMANPRIEAGIAWVRDLDTPRVVVLAHSCGSHMAQHWIRVRGQTALEQLDAFIGIGMGATDYGQPMREPFVLDQIGVPVLDIYAEYDFPAVRRMAPERLNALKRAGNARSAQLVVADADHYFRDRGETLVKAVASWLDTL